jgi:hypothetical protein
MSAMDRHLPDDDEDDRRTRALFSALERPEPSAAFRRRLLQMTRSAWPAPARSWGGVRSELVLSAGVLVGAAMLTLAPAALLVMAFLLDAGVLVKGLARGCVMLVEWVSAGFSMWDVTARAASAAGTALLSPMGTALLIAGVLTASLALAGLSRVLPGEQGDM